MINKAILIGRITFDVDVKTSSGGSSYTKFSIAMNRVGSEQTDFINCVAFGKVAENMGKFLKKGSLIGLEGRIQSSTYKRQDGSNATSIEVVANTVQFLETQKTQANPTFNKPAPKVSIEEVNKGLAKFDEDFNPDPKPKKEMQGNSNLDEIPWDV